MWISGLWNQVKMCAAENFWFRTSCQLDVWIIVLETGTVLLAAGQIFRRLRNMSLYSARTFQSSFECKFASFLFISPLLVEDLKCHKVNETLVFGSSWRFQLDTLRRFVFFILLFHCLMQRCWASNFLKEGYSYTIVRFPISLQNTFSVPLGWHQLQEYVTYIYFLFYHMLSQEFSSLQDYETIKMKKIGSFRLHQVYFSWLMLSESHAQSGFRQCSNISRVGIIPLTPLSAVTVPELGEGGHIFLLMQTSKNVGYCGISFILHHGRTGSLEK